MIADKGPLEVLKNSLIIMLLGSTAFASSAYAEQQVIRYSASLRAIPVGKIELRIITEPGSYDVRAVGAYGFPGFTKRFTAEAAGKVLGSRLQPQRYNLSTESVADPDVMIAFEGRKAVASEVNPELPSEGRIPLLGEHRVGVVDPLTALLSLASVSEQPACTSKASVFSGMSRFDVSLSAVPVATPNRLDCLVNYTRIAGHLVGEGPVRKTVITFFGDDPKPFRWPDEVRLDTIIGPLTATRDKKT